jgi:hypothetical protein
MRRMEGVVVVDRTARDDADVAEEIVGLLDRADAEPAGRDAE